MIGGSTGLNLLFVTCLVARSHLAYLQAPRAELLRDTIALARAAQFTIWKKLGVSDPAERLRSRDFWRMYSFNSLSLMIDVLDLLQFSQSAD